MNVAKDFHPVQKGPSLPEQDFIALSILKVKVNL